MRKSRLIFIFLFLELTVAAVFLSCKKEAVDLVPANDLQERFFHISNVADLEITDFVKEIKVQNDKNDFLPFFIKNNGYPFWNDARISKTDQGVLAIIPFALDNAKIITGFIVATKDQNNAFTFSLYRSALLPTYGWDKRSHGLNSIEVQTIINYFNRKEFNIISYSLLDGRMLSKQIQKQWPNNLDKAFLKGKIKSYDPSILLRSSASSCIFFTEETDWWWDPDGESDPEHDS